MARPSRMGMKPYIAEFLGTALLIVIGDGSCAQVILSDHQYGTWLSINISFAAAVLLSSYFSDPSPDINPAVTLASFIVRPSQSSLRTLPGKILAQFLGAFVGAAIVYATYFSAIHDWDPELTIPRASILHPSAGIFATYPSALLKSNWEAVWNEMLGSAVLMFGIHAISDPPNTKRLPAPQISMFILLLVIGTSLGWQTGYAINPARDLGPRIFSSFVYGTEVFSAHDWYAVVPVVGPLLGCLLGAVTYDALLYEGEGSAVTDMVSGAEERRGGGLRLD